MRKTFFVAALLSLSVSAGAMAQQQQHGGTPEEQKACSRDVQRHCRAEMNGSDLAILDCLQRARTNLTNACDQVLTNNGFPNPNPKR